MYPFVFPFRVLMGTFVNVPACTKPDAPTKASHRTRKRDFNFILFFYSYSFLLREDNVLERSGSFFSYHSKVIATHTYPEAFHIHQRVVPRFNRLVKAKP